MLDNWTFGKYGNELLDDLVTLIIAPMQPKPKKRRRIGMTGDGGAVVRKAKRPRTSRPQAAQTPTAVKTSGSFRRMTPEVPQAIPNSEICLMFLSNPYATCSRPRISLPRARSQPWEHQAPMVFKWYLNTYVKSSIRSHPFIQKRYFLRVSSLCS